MTLPSTGLGALARTGQDGVSGGLSLAARWPCLRELLSRKPGVRQGPGWEETTMQQGES